MKKRSERILFILSLFALTTCASNSEPETALDQGGALGYRYTVVCRDELQNCYDKCQSLCPQGYVVVNRVRGKKVGDQTEYSLIIRCRDK